MIRRIASAQIPLVLVLALLAVLESAVSLGMLSLTVGGLLTAAVVLGVLWSSGPGRRVSVALVGAHMCTDETPGGPELLADMLGARASPAVEVPDG